MAEFPWGCVMLVSEARTTDNRRCAVRQYVAEEAWDDDWVREYVLAELRQRLSATVGFSVATPVTVHRAVRRGPDIEWVAE